MKRRQFLKIAGGGFVLAAAGTTGFVTTRTPTKALAPWGEVGIYDDPRKNALSYAILAPNPHNRQPWSVALEGDDRLTLYFDTERQLPATDPFDRQLTIGLGCFLELMTMAANANGYDVETELFPEGESEDGLDNRPIATAKFRKADVTADPLWRHVPNRRSNKEPFDTAKKVAPEIVKRITETAKFAKAGGSVEADDITFWRKLTTDALRKEVETPHTYKESVDLFRIGKSEINKNPDGIDFSGPLFETLALTGMMSRETALDRSSTMYKEGIAAVLANAETAMGHLWLVTETNTRKDQILTGADWLRLNLAATAEGIAFQPLSQALQEYKEVADYYRKTHERLAPSGGTVQMLSRIGYGPTVPVSPRWPLTKKLRV